MGCNLFRQAARLACLTGVLMLLAASTAVAQDGRFLTFKQMVDQSDTIFVAECSGKQAVVRNGQIITRYKLRPSEILKGAPRLNAQGEVEMEELGGMLEGPVPLAAHVSHMANIPPGEEVLLFTVQKQGAKGIPARKGVVPTISADSPRILGLNQGYYHILRDPETGMKMVSRADSRLIDQKIARETERQLVRQSEKSAAANENEQKAREQKARIAASARTKGAISRLAQQSRAAREQLAQENSEMAGEIYQFEPLSEVKARIAAAATVK